MATNVLDGLQYIQQQIESGRQQGLARRYNRLAGEAFNAPDEATRNAAIGQIAVNNPDAATKLRTGYQAQDDTRARRAANVAKSMLDAVKSGNPAMIQGTWRAVRPFLSEMNPGAQIPEQWTPEMEASLHQAVAAASGLGGTNADLVQSTRIGADGYYYTVDRTGNWTNSGIKADPRTQLRDQPGVTPGIVDLRTGTVSGLQEGGQQPTPGGQPQPGPVSVGTGVGGVHMNIEGLDPERQRRLAQTLSFMQQAGYPGEEIDAFLQAQLSQPRNGSSPQAGQPAPPQAMPQAPQAQPAPQPFAPANAGPAAMRPAASQTSELDRRIAMARSMGATDEEVRRMVLGSSSGGDGAIRAVGDTSKTGADYLASLDSQTAEQVRALAEGRMQFPSGTALKDPHWQAMLAAVSQYDPSFDAVNYGGRSATWRAFNSGAEAKTVNALNTVAEHLGLLSDAAQALNNTSFPLWNRAANAYLRETGDPRISRFETARKAAADEVARVWRASGGSEADIQENLKNLDAAQSPEQLNAAIGTLTDLIGGKIQALQEQFNAGMGTTHAQRSLITPAAQRAFDLTTRRMRGGAATAAPSHTAAPAAGGRTIKIGGSPYRVVGGSQANPIIDINGRRYLVKGGDPNDPDLEEVR